MVQKATGTPSARGRPPKFDREAVVDAAIKAFWAEGLDATTLPELEVATGVDRSTLYNSFGGKTGLYELATARYLEQAEDWLFGPLRDGSDDGFSDILEFLQRLGSGLTSETAQPGCLIVNHMGSGQHHDPGNRYQEMLETSLIAALTRAGDRSSHRIQLRAALMASSVVGINLMSRAGRSAAEIGHFVDALTAQVEAWRS